MRGNKALGGNVPTPAELHLVRSFVSRRLDALESLDLYALSPSDIKTHCADASSIRQSFSDLASDDGGRYGLAALIDETLDCGSRINRFLDRAARVAPRQVQIGSATKTPPMPPWRPPSSNARTYSIRDYLDYLEVAAASIDPDSVTLRQATTRLGPELVESLLGFLMNLAGAPSDRPNTVVFLLRDTLLLCLGMRRLSAKGWPIDVRALLLNRALLEHLVQPPERPTLYVKCYNAIFEAYDLAGATFGKAYLDAYRNRLLLGVGRYLERLTAVLAAQAPFASADRSTVVDIGVHGTMPLLCMSLLPSVTDLRMYTAVPWLQDFYGNRLYTRQTTQMRRHEQLVCQERLFQCHVVTSNEVLVAETPSETVRREAYLEVRMFLDAVDRACSATVSRK